MDVSDIEQKYLSRERTRCEIYQQIVDRCFRRLFWAVEQGHTSLYFKIPPWIFGLPRYSIDECELYLLDALRHKGYYVRKIGRGEIEVDWSKYLPDPKQVRETVRHEHTQKMKTPRNKLTICDNNWLGDGPLYPNEKGQRRLALPGIRPVLTDAKPFTANNNTKQLDIMTRNQLPRPASVVGMPRPGSVVGMPRPGSVVGIQRPGSVVGIQRPVMPAPAWSPPMQQFQQGQFTNNGGWVAPIQANRAPSVISRANSKTSMSIKW